jgi:hypothetical protein
MISRIISPVVLGCVLSTPHYLWSAHPLVTDDTGTQGQGKFQLETNGQYDHDKEDGVTTKGGQLNVAVTYGVLDNVDVAVGIPYLFSDSKEDGIAEHTKEHGFSDTTLDVKWRFFENNGVSFAVKPGLDIPTGNSDKGLGAGKLGGHLYLVGTLAVEPWTFLANVGYMRNETDADDEEKNLWHLSTAALYSLNDQWKLAANLVAERNTDTESNVNPVSAIAGVIFSPTEDIDLDFGVQTGLTSSATDFSILAGVTIRL